MEDTLTRGRLEREQEGPWEVEVSYGGEVDLHKHLITCVKNPCHEKFVAVGDFNMDHLPPGCRDNDLVDLVRAMTDLTVRVSVKHVSENRPLTVPGSDRPYPCYQRRGKDMMRVGTGWVCGVQKYVNENSGSDTCTCNECLNSHSPLTQYAHIQIVTAAHVVYDDDEGAHATCLLFYDSGSTPNDCVDVVALTGMSDVMSNLERDWCEMTYITHDLDLADKLGKMVHQWDSLERRLGHRYSLLRRQMSSSTSEELSDSIHTLTIIVSHPHGCSKQVSIGHYVDRGDSEESWSNYIYTTATCPGSSGAKVWVTGWGDYGFLYYIRTHCGNCEWNKEFNYSTIGYPTGKH